MKSSATSVLIVVSVIVTAVSCPAQSWDDAEILALEVSGQLTAPPALWAQIAADLAAIRAKHPYMETIHVFPAWKPGEILVRLTAAAWADYQAGRYHGLDDLNEQYGPVDTSSSVPRWLRLRFQQVYHPVVLARIYEDADGVELAEPNHFVGDGDDITANALGVYTFRHAWGDCPAGCINEHTWVFEVRGLVVVVLDEWGDQVPVENRTWAGVKALYR